MPPTPSAADRVSLAPPRGVVVTLVAFALGALSAAKGFNTSVSDSASYFYLTDFRYGVIARGLVGEALAWLTWSREPTLDPTVLLVWHVAALLLIVAGMARIAAVAAARQPARLWWPILLLPFVSPLVMVQGLLTAGADLFILLAGLGVVLLARAERLNAARALAVASLLMHQLSAFVVPPLLVLASLLHGREGGRAAAVSAAVALAGLATVLALPDGDQRFEEVYKASGIVWHSARSLYVQQLSQSFVQAAGAMADLWAGFWPNMLFATFHASLPAWLFLAIGLATSGLRAALRRGLPAAWPARAAMAVGALLLAGTCLTPLVVLSLAYDVSRLASLAVFTATLALFALMARAEPVRPPRGFAAVAAVLALLYLLSPAFALWPGGAMVRIDERRLTPSPWAEVAPLRRWYHAAYLFYSRDERNLRDPFPERDAAP